jgi:glucan phosphoethanolaminetransferase (alkaline phosphatase superfamily)
VYLTATNILLVALVLAAAAVLPWLMRGVPRQFARLAVVSAIAVVLLGPIASSRADTRGIDRNVVTALIGTGSPRALADPCISDFRQSRFEADATKDLSRFRGTAQGFNVVMVSLESTAAQYLSLYGGEYEVMPNLSALARKALVFDRRLRRDRHKSPRWCSSVSLARAGLR